MKTADMMVTIVVALVLAIFAYVPGVFRGFNALTHEHDFLMSFITFGILCTFGESIALRITAKRYSRPGFGVLPRFLLWGLIGLLINAAFIICAMGVPHLVAALGLPLPADSLAGGNLSHKLGMAFCSSVALGIILAFANRKGDSPVPA